MVNINERASELKREYYRQWREKPENKENSGNILNGTGGEKLRLFLTTMDLLH